jgi:hypothetical protein
MDRACCVRNECETANLGGSAVLLLGMTRNLANGIHHKSWQGVSLPGIDLLEMSHAAVQRPVFLDACTIGGRCILLRAPGLRTDQGYLYSQPGE